MNCLECNKSFNGWPVEDYLHHIPTHTNITKFNCIHCSKIFNLIAELRRHLNVVYPLKYFPKAENQPNLNKIVPLSEYSESLNITQYFHKPISSTAASDLKNYKFTMLKQLIKLLSDFTTPRSKAFNTIKLVIESNIATLNLVKKNLKLHTEDVIFLNDLQNILIESSNMTEASLRRLLIKHNVWIERKCIILEEEQTFSVTEEPIVIKFSLEYVTISDVMTKILNKEELLNIIVNFIEDAMSNLNQEFRKSLYESECFKTFLKMQKVNDPDYSTTLYIPYSTYSDDFQPKNTLGSHGDSYGVGNCYLVLHCFPPKLKSKLDFIFFLMSYYSGDKKKYGSNEIYRHLVDEIENLSSHKIQIHHPKYKFVRMKFMFLMGDNAEIHEILGFTKSFSAEICCRFCYASKLERRTQSCEKDSLLRNPIRYAQDVLEQCPQSTGVASETIFSRISDFSPSTNDYVDLMHDGLLGAFQNDISYSLLELYKSKALSLVVLNANIKEFNFGPNTKNRVNTITLERLKKGKVKGTASELQALILYLPLILLKCGVPPENDYFKMILSTKNSYA